MKISKPKIIEISVQVALLMMMLLPPVLINYFSSYNISTIGLTVKVTILMTLPMVIVYLLNFYLFVPYFYFRHRRWVFLLAQHHPDTVCQHGAVLFQSHRLADLRAPWLLHVCHYLSDA
jgi:Na+-driven multidrug efflux pump